MSATIYTDVSTEALFDQVVAREREWALRMVTAGVPSTPEMRDMAWRFLKQHGATEGPRP